MRKAIVIEGTYKGETGMATEPNKIGNVMFYPDSECVYRVCLESKKIQYEE